MKTVKLTDATHGTPVLINQELFGHAVVDPSPNRDPAAPPPTLIRTKTGGTFKVRENIDDVELRFNAPPGVVTLNVPANAEAPPGGSEGVVGPGA